MDLKFSVVTRKGPVTIVTLSRPEVYNALHTDAHFELNKVFDDFSADPEQWVAIVTGAGDKAFCAGNDLKWQAAGGKRGWDKGGFAGLTSRFDCDKPIIAAVNGVAAGAGANIALACDIVLAARGASFIQAFAKIGLVPDSGGTWILPRLVGAARARGLALLAEPLPAEKAEAWGLIWKAVDDDKLMAEAEKLAVHFAMAPTFGLAQIKRALDAAETNGLDAQLDLERDLQRQAGASPDYAEGVKAFMDKRAPNFSGRRS